MRTIMARVWNGEAPVLRLFLFLPLLVLSGVYRMALAGRESLYRMGIMRTEQAAIPVISVGNISLGGTGKTTVVEWLSRALRERGLRPGIVMRGYKKKRAGAFAVDPKKDTAESAGDEAAMLARRTMLPVLVGKRRKEGIERGIRESGIDIAIFDDGYQVRNVRKNVEVLVLNAQAGKDSTHLFPLGFLREPKEAVKRADVVLVNKGELTGSVKQAVAGIPAFHVRYRPLYLYSFERGAMTDYRYLKGRKTLAFSGLGDNESFFGLLREIGADLVRTVEFPDHHRYSDRDIERLMSEAEAEIFVTTEKDAVKIEQMKVGENFFYLSIEAHIENEADLIDLILTKARA
jgi:tetraacyldisaccharide 4'-kinase